MKKLWQKYNIQNPMVDDYCSAEGVVLDQNLVTHDVYGSIAHAQALFKLGIINIDELKKLKKCFKEILKLNEKGDFVIEPVDEDVHTKVENFLTEHLGDLGKKIHMARSRNDQVLVDLRLYSKEEIFKIASITTTVLFKFLTYAKQHEFIPMPGYTHMQKAMPSSVGMWSSSFAESLLDDLSILKTSYDLNDQSPLGTGAAYGLPLNIDRELTASLLGFSKVQQNSLYTQVSRLKVQMAIMASLSQLMVTLSRFAQDLMIFTTSEYNFFTVDPTLCTGSSIMPQKKNLDIMETLRAKTHKVIGYEQQVASIASGLPSGYNADFGETKGPFMKSFESVSKSLGIVSITLDSLVPNVQLLEKACTPEIYATHYAYQLVKKGIPFRDAYVKIGKSLGTLLAYDSIKALHEAVHIGATGNLCIEKTTLKVKKEAQWWEKEQLKFHHKIISLIK